MKLRFTRFLILAFLFSPFFSYCQGEFNNWYFGWYPPWGAAVTFNSGTPVAIPNGVMLSEVSVNISDSLGTLLFFSNGGSVWNKNKIVMANGSGL